jgi:hypothetical protein
MALPLFSLPGRRRIVAPGDSNWLTLPYLHTFDYATIGQTPDGWGPTGDTSIPENSNVAKVVANKSAGWDPNRQALHFDTGSTQWSEAELQLPSPVNASAGFRISLWMVCEVQSAADGSIFFTNGWDKRFGDDPDTFGGIKITPRSVNPNDLTRTGLYGVTAQSHTPTAGLGASVGYWARYDVQWTPSLPNITTKVTNVHNSTVIHNAGVNPAWGAAVAAVFSEFSHLTIVAPQHYTAYHRDYWLLGFWIGSLTDDWPALQMPLSL